MRRDGLAGNRIKVRSPATARPPGKEPALKPIRRKKPETTLPPKLDTHSFGRGPSLIERQPVACTESEQALIKTITSELPALTSQGIRQMKPRQRMPLDVWNKIVSDKGLQCEIATSLDKRVSKRAVHHQIAVVRDFHRYLRKCGMPEDAQQVAWVARFTETTIDEVKNEAANSAPELFARWTKLARLKYLTSPAEAVTAFLKDIALKDLEALDVQERLAIVSEMPHDGPLGQFKPALLQAQQSWETEVAEGQIAERIGALDLDVQIDTLLGDMREQDSSQRTATAKQLEETLSAYVEAPSGDDSGSVLDKWNRVSDAVKKTRLDKDGSLRLRMLQTAVEPLPLKTQHSIVVQMSKQLHGSYQVTMRLRSLLESLPKPKRALYY